MKKRTIAVTAGFAALLGAAAINAVRCLPIPEKPKKDRIRLACIGDSITFGMGVFDTRKRDAWPAVLERRLGAAYQVINFGYSGATVQREGDHPYRKLRLLEKAKKARPSVILLMLGTNDSKPYNWDERRYREQYEELVRELRDGPWPHRLLLLVPPRAFPEKKTGVVAFDIVNGTIRDSIRPIVLSVGDRYGLEVVDLYALTETHPEYFDDGVHPNAIGNRAIAEYLYQRLEG